jgi:ElaB/YqjD/DUF883 family membrane-anchored ribosome-binding protein
MDPSILQKLMALPSASESLAGWKVLLGEDFEEVRPHLLPCHGEHVGGYPNPEGGGWLTVRESGDGYVAFATGDEAEVVDDVRLVWDDVQAWRLDLKARLSEIRETMNIQSEDQMWVMQADWGWCTALYPDPPVEKIFLPGKDRSLEGFVRGLTLENIVARITAPLVPDEIELGQKEADRVEASLKLRRMIPIQRLDLNARSPLGRVPHYPNAFADCLKAAGLFGLARNVAQLGTKPYEIWERLYGRFFLEPLLRIAICPVNEREAALMDEVRSSPDRIAEIGATPGDGPVKIAALWFTCGLCVERGNRDVAEMLWGCDPSAKQTGGHHLAERVRERVQDLGVEGPVRILAPEPYRPETILWNEEPFTVELPPECWFSHAPEHVSMDNYYPDLSEGATQWKDLPWDEIRNGCMLYLIGCEHTLHAHILMDKPKEFLPEEVHTTGTDVGFHKGGVVKYQGQERVLIGCLVLETEKEDVEKISMLRRARGDEDPENKDEGGEITEGPEYQYRRTGPKVWEVVFEGSEPFHLEETIGVLYIDWLLHHPGDTISSLELEQKFMKEKGDVRSGNTTDPNMDPKAKLEAQKRLRELSAERARFESEGNTAALKELDEETEEIKKALQSANHSKDDRERARDSVRKAIERVRKKLERGKPVEKKFAACLKQNIKPGKDIVFQRERGILWK